MGVGLGVELGVEGGMCEWRFLPVISFFSLDRIRLPFFPRRNFELGIGWI